MQIKRPPFVVIILAVAILLAGAYYLYNATRSANSALTASGTVEATEILIAPELSGKVTEVLVNQGDIVKADDVLFRLDDTLPQSQHYVSAAALDTAKAASDTSQTALEIAQAQYQVALQAALAQDKQARLGDWRSPDQQRFDQPNWYFTRAEQAQAVQIQVDEASKAMADAKAKLTEIEQSLDKADFFAAEKRLLNARLVYLINKDVNTRAQNAVTADAPVTAYNFKNCAKDQGYHYASPDVMNQEHGCVGDEHLTKASEILYEDAKAELDLAQQSYNDLLTTQAADDVLQARADVSVAQERYYAALDQLRALQTGDQSPSVTAAQRVVDQAQAAYDQSQKAVAQMRASLKLIDTQIAKLIITAPTDGMILTRAVEPGEVVMPGSGLLTMARLSDLTITVYIPEDRYGEISMGQTANVTVDSFPGENFTATVMYISGKAEFTPRNVQTVEGRKTTVFAIKLMLEDAGGKLKPGMPADVLFK